jgi:hypothetical protein
MSILFGILTHRSPADVGRHHDALKRVLPDAECAICYGGPQSSFDDIDGVPKVFLTEPTLREPVGTQDYSSVFAEIYRSLIEPDPAITYVHLIEFDHVIVHPGYEAELERVLDATQADWLGRHCVDRTHSNWWHALRAQDDVELLTFLGQVSGNPESSQVRIFGGIANACTISRRALEAFVSAGPHLPRYVEMYAPTVLYQMGFRVRDANRISRIFDHLRFTPPLTLEEVAALQPRQPYALHPIKDYEVVLPAALSLVPRARSAVALEDSPLGIDRVSGGNETNRTEWPGGGYAAARCSTTGYETR